MKKEEMIQKIVKETGKPIKLAAIMAGRLDEIGPALQPCLAAWENGNQIDFSYQEITLDEIMKKENCSYLEAIFSMQVLMEKPHLAANYKKLNLRRK